MQACVSEGQGHPHPAEQEEDALLIGAVGTTGESRKKKQKPGLIHPARNAQG